MTDSSGEPKTLLELVKQRYGKRLTDDQIAEVEKQINRNLETAKELHSVELTNADEPYNVFKPYRREK